MKQWSDEVRTNEPNKKIAFVPTMGALHKGHCSLVNLASEKADYVVVSIFVNPIQFNQKEDFEKYPKNYEQDIQILQDYNVDILFLPSTDEVFPNGSPKIQILIPSLTKTLCGATRPGHFDGVLWIVHNLFMWVRPHIVLFGQKDYQQCLVIKNMIQELFFPIDMIIVPTVREETGLAMSSRNTRLSEQGKKEAIVIYKTLSKVKEMALRGDSISLIYNFIETSFIYFKVDYASLYNPNTLEPISINTTVCTQALCAVALWVEGVRLIDNELILWNS